MTRARILVVDDELAIVDALSEVRADEGYECGRAENGASALTAMRAARPDLVITDVMMPVLDGRELVRRMSEDATLADVPVVLMSAAPSRTEDAGPRRTFLRKPFSIDDLLRVVRDAVG